MEPKGEGPALNFELPPVHPEHEQGQEAAGEAPAAAEQVGKRPAQPALPAAPVDIPAVDQPVIGAPSDDATAIAHPSIPDHDRIEHEWVEKAKNVIAQTRDDPYQQKDQMSKVKAEYIQKRFGKQIKTDEAAA